MSREIKFRAWDGKKMHTNDFLLSPDKAEILTMQTFPFSVEKWELMQFTGLKDKNGKEIYEGDIMQNSEKDYVWTVIWNNANAEFMGADRFSYKEEVIGNIYENKELLT